MDAVSLLVGLVLGAVIVLLIQDYRAIQDLKGRVSQVEKDLLRD